MEWTLDQHHRREREEGEPKRRRRPEPAARHPVFDPAMIGPYPAGGLARRARQVVGLSQRQMANRAKVSPATIGRIETGELMPSLAVFQRLVGAAGLFLVVVDQEGRVVEPAPEAGHERNSADRRYPDHHYPEHRYPDHHYPNHLGRARFGGLEEVAGERAGRRYGTT